MSFLDEIPITSGYRYSTLGYTDIPEVAAFTKDPLFEIFSNKKDRDSKNFGTGMKFEDIWRSQKKLENLSKRLKKGGLVYSY